MSGPMTPSHETSGVTDPAADPMPEHRGPRRKVRILLVTSLYPTPDRPEAGAFVARRVAALRARGVEVRLVASPSYRQGAGRRHLGLIVEALRSRGRIDGVEGHVAFPAGSIALLEARLRRRPCVLYAHGADVREAARRSPIHAMLAGATVRLADRVVANSASTAALVERLGGRATVVPPGVDLGTFSPGGRDAARDALGLPRDALVALYLGALIERKGADLFAEAVDRSAGWLGVMVGRGDLEASIRTAHPTIRLVGPAAPEAVPAWLRAADVVIVPSRAEPLGLAAVEALACGVPVVAAAVDGLREVVAEGRNGLLVPPGDVTAIAASLDALRDPGLRERLGSAARESVAGHDIARTTERMAAIWAKLGVRA